MQDRTTAGQPTESALDAEAQGRRDFLKKAAVAGVAVPAAALLLSANFKGAAAQQTNPYVIF